MFALIPHPDHPPTIDCRLSVAVDCIGAGYRLNYFLAGNIDRLRLPPVAPPGRADGLWKTTCFEAFVCGNGPAYCEFNFSPSGQWAAYGFRSYREGMHDTATLVELRIERRPRMLAAKALVHADFDRSDRMALTAVVEQDDGTTSYWSLTHPPGPPDFHNQACFALPLADIAGR